MTKKKHYSYGTQALSKKTERTQEYYDDIKNKFAEERDLRLAYRPEGLSNYTSELSGELAKYEIDPYGGEIKEREPINDSVECLFIGGGFSALLTSARLREKGVDSIRIVEKGADVGGTWYWNRYPGAACDVVSYDYLPLLDEMDYVPTRHYATSPEIYSHCQAIAEKYNLYELATFQTTVTSTVWDAEDKTWHVKTDRGDLMKAKYVICANGPLTKPKLADIEGLTTFKGHSFHTSRWDYDYCGKDLENLANKVVGFIGTGATAVQAIPSLAASAKELYVFQRTPSSIDVRADWPTDPNWARRLKPGWQKDRREAAKKAQSLTAEQKEVKANMPPDQRVRMQENANIDYMMRIHQRIEETVDDPETAEALKPWYMFMCKRPCFHNEYLPSFNRSNVHLVDTHGKGVTQITEKGPVFDGKTYAVDLLIYGTGFEVQKTGVYNTIIGENGLNLEDKYNDGIRTLVGVHTHGFPNMFIMGGLQSSFQFNLTDMLFSQGDHIAGCIDYARQNDINTMDATDQAEEWWVQEVISHRGKTGRNEECTPGYYNQEGESQRRQDGNYNGGINEYIDHMKDVREHMKDNFVLTA
ncbi:MAG: NAD(P)/FAD-dependent oxidoreductase [Pseudomonadales bacterium]|nr:NAD(P)/FAD-dependent oxidoreductase [Pseudomonadales bacterium]